jgi:mRNA-degrading endonuclease RelE of RelBE toxin-antitoxin system
LLRGGQDDLPYSSPSPYSVEVAPAAWKQLAHLTTDDYGVLQQRLTALSVLASEGRLPDPRALKDMGVETTLSFPVGDFVLLYQVDRTRAAIRLTEVALRLEGLDARSSPR